MLTVLKPKHVKSDLFLIYFLTPLLSNRMFLFILNVFEKVMFFLNLGVSKTFLTLVPPFLSLFYIKYNHLVQTFQKYKTCIDQRLF